MLNKYMVGELCFNLIFFMRESFHATTTAFELSLIIAHQKDVVCNHLTKCNKLER